MTRIGGVALAARRARVPSGNHDRRCGRAIVPAISPPGVDRGQERGAPSVLARHEHAARDRVGRARRVAMARRPARPNRLQIGSRPNSARSRRLLPAPSAPVTATISPARTSRSKLAAPGISRTPTMRRQPGWSAVACGPRTASSRLRPIIARTAAPKSNGCAWSATRPPVAQDHDPVGDAPDVAKAMRDIEHADAAPAQSIDDREKSVRLGSRQARGRLVEDQHRSLGSDRPGDGDELTMRGTKRAEVLIEWRVKPNAVGDPLRLPGDTAPGDKRARAAATKRVEHEVLGDGQAGNAKLVGRLVDDDDPAGSRGLRRGEPQLAAGDDDAPAVRPGRRRQRFWRASICPRRWRPSARRLPRALMARSTSSSACVAPNRFDTERSERAGATAEDELSIGARRPRARQPEARNV